MTNGNPAGPDHLFFTHHPQRRQRAGLQPLPRDERTQGFMTQAVLALSDAFNYPAPMAFELKEFKQVQASVFQVTRSPAFRLRSS